MAVAHPAGDRRLCGCNARRRHHADLANADHQSRAGNPDPDGFDRVAADAPEPGDAVGANGALKVDSRSLSPSFSGAARQGLPYMQNFWKIKIREAWRAMARQDSQNELEANRP